MAEKRRLGRQTPTQSIVLQYKKTRGDEAVALYEQGGRTAMEWQKLLIYDILAVDEQGLWAHTKFGLAVPRRNGKNEVVLMREKFGLQNGEHILHTAHRTTTSHAAWERLCSELDHSKVEYKSIRAKGSESITLPGGGKIEFRTRSSKGGLGEGFDLLVIDEAQEYGDDEESALKYVVSDSQNPQTIFTGTPPTMTSSGTVFLKLRTEALAGRTKNTGWAEWSVEFQTDPHDVDAWYEANPSMGVILNERKVEDEIGGDAIDFNIQRLGLWLRYNQKSAISEAEWKSLQCEALPKLRGKLYAGVKYGHDGKNVALSIAVKTTDGSIFLECIDCRPVRAGRSWIVAFLAAADVAKVAVDGAGAQELLAADMKNARLKAPVLPTVKQIVTANAAFEQAMADKAICHMGQPSVTQAAANCEKRAIGQNGGFGYRAIKDGVVIELLDSMILAYWLCASAKPPRRQIISY